MKFRALVATTGLLMIAFTALASNTTAVTPTTLGPGVPQALDDLAPGETLGLIITFKPGADRELLVATSGLKDATHFESFPVSYAFGTARQWDSLARRDGVIAVEVNEELDYHMATAATATRVRAVQAGAVLAGGSVVDGTGVGVAIVDSGVDCSHPDLVGACIPSRTLKNVPGLTTFVNGYPNTDEHVGHGTHVAGIAVGDGTASAGVKAGVAPGARLYSYSHGVGLSVLGTITAFNHILANPSAPGEPPIRVLSNSWGTQGGNPAAASTTAVNALVAAGITVIFSAGNDFDDPTIGLNSYCKIAGVAPNPPGPLAGLLCVASYADGEIGTSEGGVSSFSSRAIVGDPAGWLDISAPGDTIEAARALTGVAVMALSQKQATTQNPDYVTISGTSMAAPHVAGVVALVQSARLAAALPALTPGAVNTLITGTAHAFGNWAPYWNRHAGAGLVDAQAAVESTLGVPVSVMPASQLTYSNRFDGIVFSGTGLTLNSGAGPSTLNGLADFAGLGSPAPSGTYVTPGATVVRLRAFTEDAGFSVLGEYNPGMTVCAVVTYLASGSTFSTCLVRAGTPLGAFYDSGSFAYSYLVDGDVSVDYTFDLNGNGIVESNTDRVVNVVYDNLAL